MLLCDRSERDLWLICRRCCRPAGFGFGGASFLVWQGLEIRFRQFSRGLGAERHGFIHELESRPEAVVDLSGLGELFTMSVVELGKVVLPVVIPGDGAGQ